MVQSRGEDSEHRPVGAGEAWLGVGASALIGAAARHAPLDRRLVASERSLAGHHSGRPWLGCQVDSIVAHSRRPSAIACSNR